MVCRERTPPTLVRVAGHFTASNNRIASRLSSRTHHSEFHFNAQVFRRQDPPSPPQYAVFPNLGASQNLMTARHTRLCNTKSLFESLHFLRRLELALRPKSPVRSLKANPLHLQAQGEPKGKIPRRHHVPDAAALQEFADYPGESGFVLLSPLKFLFQLRITGDLVNSRFAAAAIDLEIAQQQNGSSSRLEKDKCIRRPESCGIQHVSGSLAGSDDKSCWFH